MRYLESSVTTAYTNTLPVSVADMKLHLRVTFATEDALIESYIMSAARYIETVCQLVLIDAPVTEIFTRTPGGNGSASIYLNYPCEASINPNGFFSLKTGNATAVTSITANTAEVPSTFSAMTNPNVLDAGFNKPRVYAPLGWDFGSIAPYQIKVIYRAGWATAAAIPETIKMAIKLQAANFYENRMDSPQQMIQASEILMRPFATAVGI